MWQGVLPVPVHVCVRESGICGDRNVVLRDEKATEQLL